MTTDEYVPSDEDVRSVWVVHERDCGWEPHPGDPSAEFDRFLARVRRDAARDALDGLARQEEEAFLHLHVNDAPISAAAAQYARSAAEAYKHEHYPTPEETP